MTTAEGQAFAQQNELAFLETSALDGNNVETTFSTTVNEIYKEMKKSMGGPTGATSNTASIAD